MSPNPSPPPRLVARAFALGERLDLRALSGTRLTAGSVLVPVGGGSAIVFRHGSVVFFDVVPKGEEETLKILEPLTRGRFSSVESEEAELGIGPISEEKSVEGDIVLADRSSEGLQIVADVLAKSVTLAHYEDSIAQTFDRIEPLAVELERTGKVDRRSGGLIRQVAATLLIQQRMVGRIEIAEKPELTWDRPDLDRLYTRLADEYELKERQLALERKLELISRTGELFLNLLYDKRSLRVEWYIVLLIVVEIALTLYEMATRTP